MQIRPLLIALVGVAVGYAVGYSQMNLYNSISTVANDTPNANVSWHSKLDCVNSDKLDSVRSDPKSILLFRQQCHSEMRTHFGDIPLDDQDLDAAFATVVAHSMAPYGASSSLELQGLLKDKVLDCDNYAALAGHLLKYLPLSEYRLRIVGFDGGSIGNHTQLIFERFERNNSQILLDPTIGLIAKVGYNELLSGVPINPKSIRIFYYHDDKEIRKFANRVADAIAYGKYKPSDLLYYFLGLEDYIAFSEDIRSYWETDLARLIRSFPTPAADALRKNFLSKPPNMN